MLEYRSVTYRWRGRGWTQEIDWLRVDGEVVPEWGGKYWTDFLNDMARQQWELVTVASLKGSSNDRFIRIFASFSNGGNRSFVGKTSSSHKPSC